MILTPISDEEIGKTKEIDKEEQNKVHLHLHNIAANFFS